MVTEWEELRWDLQLAGRHAMGDVPASSFQADWSSWADSFTRPVTFRGRAGWRSVGPLDAVLKRLTAALHATYQAPDQVFGFVPGRSTVQAARLHVGAPTALALDLRDFFGQIDEDRARTSLRSRFDADAVDVIVGCCFRDSALPLGFRTSPIISNIFFEETDHAIQQFCEGLAVTYSRWVDDLVFSGESIDDSFLKQIASILDAYSWRCRDSKTRFMSRRRVVLGLNIAPELPRPHIPRGIKKELRKQVYYLRKFGSSHFSHSRAWPLRRLLGMVAYVKSVDPVLARALEEQLRDLPSDVALTQHVGAAGGGRWQVRMLRELGLRS